MMLLIHSTLWTFSTYQKNRKMEETSPLLRTTMERSQEISSVSSSFMNQMQNTNFFYRERFLRKNKKGNITIYWIFDKCLKKLEEKKHCRELFSTYKFLNVMKTNELMVQGNVIIKKNCWVLLWLYTLLEIANESILKWWRIFNIDWDILGIFKWKCTSITLGYPG